MSALVIILSTCFWSVWRRAFGGWWFWKGATIGYIRIGKRFPLIATAFLAASLPWVGTAPLWACVLIGGGVCVYWTCDHEPEGPTWWSVLRYLGPVGLSWWIARKLWRDWMYRPPMVDCAGTLGEWIAGGMFGLFFGLAWVYF